MRRKKISFTYLSVLVTSGALLFLAGCGFSPVRYDKYKTGHWQSRILIRDKVNYKSNIVNAEIKAIAGEKLRIDLSTTVGGPFASLVMEGDHMAFMIIPEKAYYHGKASSRALKKLVKLPLDPKIIYNLLFDKPVVQEGWECTKNKKDYVEACNNNKKGLEVKWANRQVKKKTVIVEHAKASVQLNVTGFEEKFDDKGGNIFKLKRPKSFKSYKL